MGQLWSSSQHQLAPYYHLFLALDINPEGQEEIEALFHGFSSKKSGVLSESEVQKFLSCLYDFLASKQQNSYPLINKQKMLASWVDEFFKGNNQVTLEEFRSFSKLFVQSNKITAEQLLQQSHTVPLRVNEKERELLGILEGALEISEYTDLVDVASFQGKRRTIIKSQLKEMFSFMLGLYVSQKSKVGKEMAVDGLEKSVPFFCQLFEIGRRYKIMNPDKMRSCYGKLMWMLQDESYVSLFPTDEDPSKDNELLKPISCVHDFLKGKNALALLSSPNLLPATQIIISNDPNETKAMCKLIEVSREKLVQEFQSDQLSRQDIIICLDSFRDHNSSLYANRDPLDKMIKYLHQYFNPFSETPVSLSISTGSEGSCLTHSHDTQFKFVHQTLQFWKEIQENLSQLWLAADHDLLATGGYSLINTGQGIHRMQSAPFVAKLMSQLLGRVKKRVGDWVGLSVVHLGDRDVPNALVFIDKYSQIARILVPIVHALEHAIKLNQDPDLALFLIQFGGLDSLCRLVLSDFFKHGFDGSGDDGGSCIDGRLTSAWNWCSQLHKKSFYPIFLLSGFQGFDGSFKK